MTPRSDDTIFKHFSDLSDPRIDRTKQHLLGDIIAIAILAVLSGADTWVAIETYAQAKQSGLKQFLALPNRIPSHDTIARVFARLAHQAFEQCFLKWIESITQAIDAQVIPIDGKTMRQSFDRNRGENAIHVVSAWASEHRLVLGQLKVNSKSNEITAIPKLLELLVAQARNNPPALILRLSIPPDRSINTGLADYLCRRVLEIALVHDYD